MDGYGMGGGAWVAMLVVVVTLVGLIVFAVVRLGEGSRSGSRGRAAPSAEPTPREILDRRLARGEIDQETYRAVADRLTDRAER